MKIAELRERLQPPTHNLYDAVFTRRFSILLTAALHPSGITANQVTIVNLAVGLGACGLIAFGNDRGVLIGVVLLHIYAILDSVDGELARWRRQFSLKGLYLEDLSAFYLIVGFPLAVAMCVARRGFGNELLVIAIVYASFGRTSMAVARRAVLRSITTRRPVSAALSSKGSGEVHQSAISRIIDQHLLNHTNIRVVISTALAVEIVAGGPLMATRLLLFLVLSSLLAREAAAIVYLLHRDRLDRLLSGVYDAAKVVDTDLAKVDAFQLAKY